MTKEEKINSIDWDKDFQELPFEQQAAFCSLHKFPGVHPDIIDAILDVYETDQYIVKERGKENLSSYIN